MKYELLLFDADNTLFDYDAAEAQAIGNTFVAFGVEDTQENRALYKKFNDQAWADLEQKLVTKEELKVKRFKQLLDAVCVSKDAEAMSKHYVIELGKGIQLLPGATEFVQAIAAERKIYILTNGIHEVQRNRINNSEIGEYIEAFYTSEGIGFAKPEEAFFDHVFADLGVTDKSKAIMVGDSLTADIQGANNAGIDSCWYNPNGEQNTSEAVPTYEVASFAELKKVLDQS